MEDVLLLARRNEGLEGILRGFVEGTEKKKRGDGGTGEGDVDGGVAGDDVGDGGVTGKKKRAKKGKGKGRG